MREKVKGERWVRADEGIAYIGYKVVPVSRVLYVTVEYEYSLMRAVLIYRRRLRCWLPVKGEVLFGHEFLYCSTSMPGVYS